MCTVSTNREERQAFYCACIDQLVRGTSMCFFIVTGKEENSSTISRIDLEAKYIGNLDNQLETMNSTRNLNKNKTYLSLTLSPISQFTDPSFKDHQVVRKIDPIQLQFNLKTEPAAVVLDAIIREEDRLLARQKNAIDFQEGEIMRESIKKIKGQMKDGSMVKYVCRVLGRDVCYIQRGR